MATQKPVSMEISPLGIRVAESAHDQSFQMPWQKHLFHEIYYLQKGQVQVFMEEGAPPRILQAGVVAPIPAGQMHRLEDKSRAVILLLSFSEDWLKEKEDRRDLWNHIQKRQHFPIVPSAHHREKIENSFRLLLSEQTDERLGRECLIHAETERLLVDLARLPDEPQMTGAEGRVRRVLREMEQRSYEEWSLDAAARQARLSRRRFSQVFRILTGQSFVEKRNGLRLKHATQLMLDTRQTIAGAAFSAGFQDLSHFYRLFRKTYHLTPKDWMEKHR